MHCFLLSLYQALYSSYQAPFRFEVNIGTLTFGASLPLPGGFGTVPVRNVRRLAYNKRMEFPLGDFHPLLS